MVATELSAPTTAALVLTGRLDARTGAALAAHLRTLPGSTARLVLDLSEVTEIDPFALGSLLAARRRCEQVHVVGARPSVAASLRRAGAHMLLELHDSDLRAA